MPISPRASEPDALKRVSLRRVGDEERGAFEHALEDKPYLANARLTGQTLRYVS